MTPALAEENARLAQPAPLFADHDRPAGIDTAGNLHRFGQTSATRGLAFVFLSTECPIACKYVPELNRLAREFSPRGIEFYGVLAEPTLSRSRARQFELDYRLEFPLLFDASLELATIFAPSHTPEAFVISPRGDLLYRGRIDDRFVALGEERATVKHHELADALEAIASGRTPAVSRTDAVGCRFEALKTSTAKRVVSFNRDLAPLVWNHCTRCHREGEVAPFALTSYADCQRRAQQLAEVVASRYMPPWKAEPGFNHFDDERRLTAGQVELFAEWAAGGTLEGNPADLPPLPTFAAGWQLGEPDLVIQMAEPFDVPADGPDILRWFVLPLSIPADQEVVGFEFRPGNPRVVHHSIAFLDISGIAQRRDAADPAPGYSNFGGPGFPPIGYLGAWVPGAVPRKLGTGLAMMVPPRSVIALMMHYYPSGKPERDQSQIGLYLAKRGSSRPVSAIPVTSTDLEIPANEKHFRVTKSYTLPVDATALGAVPHMHYLGREMRVTARVPGQEQPVPLVWIKNWDFNWQGEYRFAEPIRLPKGTEIVVEGFYDNTKDNPHNPHAEPQLVRYGQETTDEMCLCGVVVALDDARQFLPLAASLIREHVKIKNGRLVIVPLDDARSQQP
ncbi:MAG: redoxin domain-containing protein [Pirellulales bacterium]|nr:redoxin domain-containing protein [Pirellulales bacterium]